MISQSIITALLLVTGISAFSQNSSSFVEKLKLLEGEWTAIGGGQPGQGEGSYSFRFDLNNKVMTRRNESHYPASGNKPAVNHEDFMIIYPMNDSLKAIYFDSEGHSISYAASFLDNGRKLEFISDLKPGTMGFRLTYEITNADTMNISFDISPDGHPGNFHSYVKGVSHRKK